MSKNYIIVPVDGSTYALQAVHYAVKMATAFNSNIRLLNVQPKYNETLTNLLSQDEMTRVQNEEAKKIFEEAELILHNENVAFDSKIRIGIPSIEISNEAKEVQAEAIIMGTRGMSPSVGQALGSVSTSVSHLTPCPLILIPVTPS